MAVDGSDPAVGAVELTWLSERADLTDLVRFNRRRKHMRIKAAVFISALIVVGSAGYLLDNETIVTAALTGSSVLILMLMMQPLFIHQSWKRNPALRQRLTALVSVDGGIAIQNASASSIYPWSGITSFYETDRLFLLQPEGLQAMIMLAKRGLSSADEVDLLRNLLASNVGNHPTVSPPR